MFDIDILPALKDNYIYLGYHPQKNQAFVVDPGADAPVRHALARRGCSLDAILITHHHHDHVGGVAALVGEFSCPVIGPDSERVRIPGLDHGIKGGDSIDVCGLQARVLATPGHTLGHVSYWFADLEALFCGDTLFSLGCGRLFEGSPHQMWDSLQTLNGLPAETKIYCGHEYSQNHARFALTIEPDNPHLRQRAADIDHLRAQDLPTLPVTLESERACNPFLRSGLPQIKQSLGLAGAEDVEVFAALRARKDHFA